MKKCKRCGKEFKDDLIEICDECGYNFDYDKKISKVLDEKNDPDIDDKHKSDLVDYPILSFIFGIIGLIVPLYLFSVLAILLSKKKAKIKLIPFANVGRIFGFLGIFVSTIIIVYILTRI